MIKTSNNIYEAVFGETSGRGNNTSAVAAIDLGKGNDPVTYAQLQSRVDGFRVSSAIKAGERIALVMPNSLELVVGLFATWAQGAATAPLNPAYTAIEFKVSNDDSTTASVTDRSFKGPLRGSRRHQGVGSSR
jgi:acyl-CoA synthetase (AMP-forming)/AMP-acid ligase II